MPRNCFVNTLWPCIKKREIYFLVFMLYFFKSVVNTTQLVVLLLFLTGVFLWLKRFPILSEQDMSASKLLHIEFEVFGRVQGVFFRKCTKEKADSLGVRGWIRNTKKNTVEGEIEGTNDLIENMKNWLRNEGSPSSRIDQAVFKNEREVQQYSYTGFSIKH